MATRRALITGVLGQDGRYLADFLRESGTEVMGIDHTSAPIEGVHVRAVDVSSSADLERVLGEFAPHEVYHLAAYHRSSATVDLDDAAEEVEHLRVNLLATQDLLRLIRRLDPDCRVFLAGSCHMFGATTACPQTEQTPFAPNSPYGITKVAAHHFAKMYRERGLLFCTTGILYNHESPRRGVQFVTGRIARAVAEIARGQRRELTVGSLSTQVDWGFAGDYVQAMVKILRAREPEDYILASGTLHRVEDFVSFAFEHVGLDWRKHVREEPGLRRANSGSVYHGDITKIRSHLGWQPTTPFEELVRMMVDHHLHETG